MTAQPVPPKRIFPTSKVDARAAEHVPSIPQTESAAYKLAFQDTEFLLREDLRPVRFQLELLKPELLLNEAEDRLDLRLLRLGAHPRAGHGRRADRRRDQSDEQRDDRRAAEGQVALLRRRARARAAGQPLRAATRRASAISSSARAAARRSWRPPTAAPRTRAQESIGLNIVLPHEQLPNRYVTPDLSFQFHYFALRKMHFLLRARAVAVFPGGFGTFDEMFELLTLIQTGKVRPLPILLFGKRILEPGGQFRRRWSRKA